MNFDAIIFGVPLVAKALVWLWPVFANCWILAIYWASQHQMTWAVIAVVALVEYWYWYDNRV